MIADTRGIDITDDLDVTLLPQQPICFIGRCRHPLACCNTIPFAQIFDFPSCRALVAAKHTHPPGTKSWSGGLDHWPISQRHDRMQQFQVAQ